jgi:hypothetical protein
MTPAKMSTGLSGLQSARNEIPSWLPHLLLLMKAPAPWQSWRR